jgi:hypothetical protein
MARKILFKGGTSLSKVFGLIERFSEDVDLILERSIVRPRSKRVEVDPPGHCLHRATQSPPPASGGDWSLGDGSYLFAEDGDLTQMLPPCAAVWLLKF